MIRHLALLRLTAETDDAHVEALVGALRALPEQIPEIRSYAVGRDLTLVEGTWDIGIDGTFDDEAAWRRYQDHPEHQRVLRELIRPVLAERSAVQMRDG